ncbi:VTT domain-containing protein [Candidatus Saccharibacteria bacterium]|nr:MAG: VTT domain-containing protein [Candidatus Saccharibacteria bacterium]
MPDFIEIVRTGGLPILFLIIFAESGMMVGFFFPGDTLLFSAGILAAAGVLPIWVTVAVISAAAIAGDNTGYHIGRKLGPRLFKKEDGLIFRKDLIMKAEKFYEKYGTKTMLVAHFIPIVRSFAPVTAGAGKMDYKQFAVYDAIGDIVWAASITLLGYFVGSRIPGVEHYIEPVLIGIILVTLIPTIYHALKDPKIRASLKQKITRSGKSQVKPTEKK